MKLLADIPIDVTLAPSQNPAKGIVDFRKLKEAFPPGGVINLRGNLTIGEILSNALRYVFVIAGLVLLFMLISGGFQMIVGAGDAKAKEGASKTITNAIVGFIILFVSYWLVQIIEIILGISILRWG